MLMIALVGMALAFTACRKERINASEEITTEYRTVSNYTRIDVDDKLDVEIEFVSTQGNIRIDAPENVHAYITTEVIGEKLKIHIKDGVKIKGNPEIKVYLTAVELNEISVEGASEVNFTNWTADDVLLDVSEASKVKGDLNVNTCKMEISQASDVRLTGTVLSGDVSVRGASKLKEFELELTHLDIELAGASKASVKVLESMSVDASGASIFNYKGEPTIQSLDLTGGSSIHKY